MIMAMPEEIRDEIVASVPVGRVGDPSHIANAVAFLSAQESSCITAANIPVNGGFYMSY